MDKEFNNLDKQVALMNQELKEIGKTVAEGFSLNSSEHKEIVKNSIEQNKELMDLFNKALEQKAAKWVEDWLVWAGRIIVGAVLLALVSLVVINK